ncbi:MAG: phage holin family protein [Fibrobacter sp.]|nr:phage holin family protein [Fibrobacter sp.]
MNEESAFILQGSVAATAIAFLQATVLRMIPYAVPSVFLIILDLLYGVKAAKHRGERARLSTAVRRSVTKLFSYLCWLVLASASAVAFQLNWIEWAVLGLVYINELASIVGNYLETKGVEVSLKDFYRWAFKAGAGKAGLEVTAEDAASIIKNRERDSRERFVKK